MAAMTKLCLVTPPKTPAGFDAVLDETLRTGNVAALLVDSAPPASSRAIAAAAVRHGIAAIAVSSSNDAVFDGAHVEDGAAAVGTTRLALGADKIVGTGGVSSRHEAMLLGEASPDYVFFGRLTGDNERSIHAKALELAAWWAELFEIPAMVMGGNDVASAAEASRAGIEFVALRYAVWNHAAGPTAAIAAANEILDREARQ